MLSDSIDKIVTSYFAAITTQPFLYKGTWYQPKQLRVSPGAFRTMVCPPNCGGCCHGSISLDYLPFEKHPTHEDVNLQPRIIEFDNKEILVFSDLQKEHNNHFCKFVNMEDGRCKIHFEEDGGPKPFSGDFELLRFLVSKKPDGRNQLTQKVFGRGWSYKRVDGGQGQRCYMTDPTAESTQDAVRRMKRLRIWANYFGVAHCADEIIDWMESGPHDRPLIINAQSQQETETNLFYELS